MSEIQARKLYEVPFEELKLGDAVMCCDDFGRNQSIHQITRYISELYPPRIVVISLKNGTSEILMFHDEIKDNPTCSKMIYLGSIPAEEQISSALQDLIDRINHPIPRDC